MVRVTLTCGGLGLARRRYTPPQLTVAASVPLSRDAVLWSTQSPWPPSLGLLGQSWGGEPLGWGVLSYPPLPAPGAALVLDLKTDNMVEGKTTTGP